MSSVIGGMRATLPRQRRRWALTALAMGGGIYWVSLVADDIRATLLLLVGIPTTCMLIAQWVWPGPLASFDHRYLYVYRLASRRKQRLRQRFPLADVDWVRVDFDAGPHLPKWLGPPGPIKNTSLLIKVAGEDIIEIGARSEDVERFATALGEALVAKPSE
jgi:hypothetical protein